MSNMLNKGKFSKYGLVISIITALLFIFILGTQTTLAFLSQETNTADNTFSAGAVTVEIKEDFTPPDELEPGIDIEKDVKVVNTDSIPCYVRVFCNVSDSRVSEWASLDYNTTEWSVPDEEGWRYYKTVLSPDDESVSLITKIHIAEQEPAHGYSSFNVPVVVEAVQAKGTDGEIMSLPQAWDNFGINIEVS